MTPRQNALFHRFRSDRRGSVAVLGAFFATALALAGGLIAQVGLLFQAQQTLQVSANMAALAGASELRTSTSSAIATAIHYSTLNPVSGMTPTMVTGYPQTKCLGSTGVSCGTDNANAIQVQEQVTLPLIFGQLFGSLTMTLTATATAGAAGGLGSAVADALLEAGQRNLHLTRLAVHEMPGSGSGDELLAWAGIDAEHIADAARQLVRA